MIVVDLCTRAIVGWAVSRDCDTELALLCLNAAVARHTPPLGLMHHTDRGSTYAAGPYRRPLEQLGMIVSMSRKGNCWDNAVAESTIGTIKAELRDGALPDDSHDVQRDLFPYIESFYNRRGLHSTLGYITPSDRESLAISDRQVT